MESSANLLTVDFRLIRKVMHAHFSKPFNHVEEFTISRILDTYIQAAVSVISQNLQAFEDCSKADGYDSLLLCLVFPVVQI